MVKFSKPMKNKFTSNPKRAENKLDHPSQNKKFNKNFKKNRKPAPILDDLSEQDMNSSDESFGDFDEFDKDVVSSGEELDDEDEFEDEEKSGEDEEVEGKNKAEEKEEEEESDGEDEEEDELEDEEDDDVSDKDSSTKTDLTKQNLDVSEDQMPEDDEMESDNQSSDDEKKESKKHSRRELVKQRKESIKASEPRTVFVGNAPVDTKRRDLRKLFRTFGEIEAVYHRTHLQMTDKMTKMMVSKTPELSNRLTSTNFYIRFAKEEQAENAARAMDGTKLNGHILRVNMAAKREFDSKRSIFVGNLPYTTLDDSVRAYFSSCGKITGVRLLRDKQTGLVKGAGYIEFIDSSPIQKALELNDLPFEGRKLRISRVYKKNKLTKIAAKNENLKRKSPKVPKGAENFMVLKRGKFEGKRNDKINKNFKNKFQQNKSNNKEDNKKEKSENKNKDLNNKGKIKFKKLFVKKQGKGLKGLKKRKSLII